VPPTIAWRLAWAAGATLSRSLGVWAGVGGVAMVLVVVVLVRARTMLRPLLVPSLGTLGWGVGAAAVMIAATRVLYALDRAGPGWTTAGTTVLYGILRTGAPRWAIDVLLPLVVLAEELIWRGVVQEAFRRRLRPMATVVLSGLAYAAAHAPIGSPLLVCVALACGLYWSALRNRTGSLVPAVICHLCWDLAIMVLWPLA
jgi:membrane protease YdiL (CAAX protease family)